MARKRLTSVKCPICKKQVKTSEPDFPFCSDRCRTIDLGKWASGGYVIPSPLSDTESELDADIPELNDDSKWKQ